MKSSKIRMTYAQPQSHARSNLAGRREAENVFICRREMTLVRQWALLQENECYFIDLAEFGVP